MHTAHCDVHAAASCACSCNVGGLIGPELWSSETGAEEAVVEAEAKKVTNSNLASRGASAIQRPGSRLAALFAPAVGFLAAQGTGTSLPLSSNASAVLSFALLNAGPSDWLYGSDVAEIEATYLQPMSEASKPVATLEVKSQVLLHTQTMVTVRWDASRKLNAACVCDLPDLVILDSIAAQVRKALAAANKPISAASHGCYDDAASHAREARFFLSKEAFFTQVSCPCFTSPLSMSRPYTRPSLFLLQFQFY
eukprot:jgi/Chlat1/1798/Chrsp135S02122